MENCTTCCLPNEVSIFDGPSTTWGDKIKNFLVSFTLDGAENMSKIK